MQSDTGLLGDRFDTVDPACGDGRLLGTPLTEAAQADEPFLTRAPITAFILESCKSSINMVSSVRPQKNSHPRLPLDLDADQPESCPAMIQRNVIASSPIRDRAEIENHKLV
jgi:hypothetical protein